MTNAKPDDTELDDASAEEDTSVNVSDKSNDQIYAPIGIFTKYPDDENEMFTQPGLYVLPDEIRMRRKIDETYSLRNGSQEMIESDEENKEGPTKVPLQGIITAIETDLVTTALLASTQLHKRQSMASEMSNDSIDANTNLFEDLFNFTRSDGQTDGKENVVKKIPLNGLVNAVESTLINSAQNLKNTEQLQPNIDDKHRIDRDTNDETVQIQTIDGSKSLQNLNILSSIAFKPVLNDTEMDTITTVGDDGIDTVTMTEHPEIQRTNFTVIHASDTFSLVPDGENKLAHVQHQAISKTVFQSNLAIFPTIAPKSLVTSGEQTSKEEINENPASATVQSLLSSNGTNKTLREKIAEVKAEPVILSSFP